MKREVIITKDGSATISIPDIKVTYHSIHGAIQESTHVFIEAGLHDERLEGLNTISILEMGFGTGLNALLTIRDAALNEKNIYYESIELNPISTDEANQLNYCDELGRPDLQPVFDRLHSAEWEKEIKITDYFSFKKTRQSLIDYKATQSFNLIYFDAFAPAAQPELWTKEVFEKMYACLHSPGILVTYCSKSEVRKNMQAAGFKIEKIAGPAGKREMIRAVM